MELHPKQVLLCCAVLYLDFLLLPSIITGVLSSPDERTWDSVEDTRVNKAQWQILITDKANTYCLCSLEVRPHQEDCVLCWVPDMVVCM